MSLTCYVVTSGPMLWTDYILEGRGPTEEYRDVVFVWARRKRDAVLAAVRHWQRRCGRPKGHWSPNPCCYPHEQRRDGLNPFAGVTAEEVKFGEDDR